MGALCAHAAGSKSLDGYPARTLKALGLLLADSAPTVGRGKTLLSPTWEMNRLSEGYKRAVNLNWSRRAKMEFFGPKSRFQAQKKRSLLNEHYVLATTGKSCSKKKVAFAQIIKGGNVILGDFLG